MNAAYRQLYIFQRLLTDHVVNKLALADHFNVTPRAIQRDLSQIRDFIIDEQLFYQLVYHRRLGGYQLETTQASVSKPVVLAIIKILLASRSLNTTEMTKVTDGLLALVSKTEQLEIQPIINNERLYYQPVHHDKPLLTRIWQLSQFIIHQTTISIDYRNRYNTIESRIILPQAVIFSEYYFYVVAFSEKYQTNRFFRVDRIFDLHPANQQLSRSRAQRVEDGDLRRYLHYMQPGKKITLRFEFTGIVEAALDRFPTAKVLQRFADGKVLIEATAFDTGASMWLLSQGPRVKVLSPASMVQTMKASLQATRDLYQ